MASSWARQRAQLDVECWGVERQRPIPAFPQEGPVEDDSGLPIELVAWLKRDAKAREEHEERMGAWNAKRGRLARAATLWMRLTDQERALLKALALLLP